MKKVSIITPWYNGISFVDRYMQMILAQTYLCLELIFIDDGSTDGVIQHIKSYEPELKKKNIAFIYLFQEHAGQAAALNKGLKIFTGDYLVSIDSDDVFVPDNIAKRVQFLEEHSSYAMVTSKGVEVDEWDFDSGRDVYWMQRKEEEKLFEKIVDRNISTFLLPYMFCREAFLEVFPERSIYVNEKTTIQDIQIILPMAYKYKCGFIDEYLFTYVIRRASGCHEFISYPHKLTYYDGVEEIWLHTYKNMQMNNEDRKKCIDKTKSVYQQYRMTTIANYLLDKTDIGQIEKNFFQSRQLVLLGAGDFGEALYNLLTEKGLQIAFFLDNSIEKQNRKFCGLSVKSPNYLLTVKNVYHVIVATASYNNTIKEQLIAMGFKEKKHFLLYPSKEFFTKIGIKEFI